MTTESAEKRQSKLIGIQFGRAIAAFLVVFYHAGRMLALPQYLGHIPALGNAFSFGNAGVDFFFALSGFIIYYVHGNDVGKPSRLGHYVWRRVTRIYPMYWLATAIVIALAISKHSWATLSADHLVKSIFLVPSQQEPLLTVGWTLTHEMLFYTVFAFAIVSRPVGVLVASIWALLVATGFYDNANMPMVHFVQSPYHIEFALGVLSAMVLRRWVISYSWIFALAGAILFVGAAIAIDLHWLQDSQAVCRLLFGSASALILYGIAAMEIRGTINPPKWAGFLGAASYSIYLFHTIAIGLLAKAIFHAVSESASADVIFVVVSVMAILAGCAIYHVVETPLQASIRRIGKGSPRQLKSAI